MSNISQDVQLLNDIKTQITQYVYRSTELPFDSVIQFIQDISGAGNMNWQKTENKANLRLIFTRLQEAIQAYTSISGDFTAYLHSNLVTILTDVYAQSLFTMYTKQGYVTTSESILASVTTPYTVTPIQNTDFPDIANTSHEFVPELPVTQLVSKSLYTDSSD